MGEQRGTALPTARALTGVAITIAMLVGCGAGGEPSAGPTTLAAPTATVSPSSTSTKPATATDSASDAKARLRQEVEAVVRAYYAAMERAVQTGDTADFEAVTHPECNCRSLVAEVRKVFDSGSTRGATVTVADVRAIDRNGALVDVDTIVDVSGYEQLDEVGNVVKEFDGHRDKRRLAITAGRAGYLVVTSTFEGRA